MFNKIILLFAVTVLIFFSASFCWSEYRVFQMIVTDTVKKTSRTFPTNLDPDQYLGYYAIGSNETLQYKSTWMCKGRTSDFVPYCKDPKAPVSPQDSPDRAPSASP